MSEESSIADPNVEERRTWAPPWMFENITDVSRHAGRILSAYVILMFYGVIALLSTTDRQLALREPIRLPLLGVGIPFVPFMILFTLGIVMLFVVLQVYLFRLKGLVVDLRTRHAAERPRRLSPGLATMAEDSEPGLLGAIQRGAFKTVVWISLPLLFMFTAAWVIRKHDPVLSLALCVRPMTVALIVAYFWYRFDMVPKETGRTAAWFTHHWGKLALIAVTVVVEVFLLALVTPLAHRGWPTRETGSFWPDKFRFLRPAFVLDLSYQSLSSPLSGGSALAADLRGARLEGADLTAVDLIRADLRGARLSEARMESCNLDEANLEQADLRSARLERASLRRTDLARANLDGATVASSDLYAANLAGARLQGTDFEGAVADRANLSGATVSAQQLLKAASLRGVALDPRLLASIRQHRPALLETPDGDTTAAE